MITRLHRALGAIAFLVVTATMAAAQTSPPEPQRIISIVPSITEILFAIGAGPRVIAVSSFDKTPREVERLPKVGALVDPDVERILSLRPNLVVIYGSQSDLAQQLARARIPVFSYRHGSLDDVTRTIRAVGKRVGSSAAAQTLAVQIERQLASIRGRVQGRARPRTMLVMEREPLAIRNVYASGGTGFIHDMLELAGARDVFGDVRREAVQVNTETILAQAPEVIIELHYTGELSAQQVEAERRTWSALGAVPAVKSGRVYLLQGDEFVVPGPRIVMGIERLARTLHPEAFK